MIRSCPLVIDKITEMKTDGRSRENWAGIGALFFLVFLLYHRIFLGGQTVVLSDSSRFFYPLWKWGAGVWKGGVIPLWNPDAGLGTPYLADPQMAAWYPPLVTLYYSLTPTCAFNSLILGHHLWAVIGFWLFARGRGLSPMTAMLGCLIFGFSFNAISLSWITSMLFAYSWIPWVFLTADRLRKGLPGSTLFFFVVTAMQMASGYPLFAYLTMLAVFLLWVLEGILDENKGQGNRASPVVWALAAVGLASLYNSAWLFPLWEMVPFTNLSERVQMSQAMSWIDLVTWFNPFANGHPLYSHPDIPFSFTVYFAGLPVLVMIFWKLLRGKGRDSALIFLLFVFLLSLGETGIVGGWLKRFLPGYVFVVRSGYWMPLVMFGTALFLANAAEEFVSERRQKSFFSAALWVFAATIVYLLALWFGVPVDLWTHWASYLFVLLSGAWMFFDPGWRKIFLAAAIVLSLGPVDRSIQFTMDRDYYDSPPTIGASLGKVGRIYHSPETMDRFRTVSGKSVPDIYQTLKRSLVPNWPLTEGWEEAGYANTLFLLSSLKWDQYASETIRKKDDRIVDYLGIRYVVGESPENSWKVVPNGGIGLKLTENPFPSSKWNAVRSALPAQGESDGVRMLSDRTFDFKRLCFIEDRTQGGDYNPRIVTESGRTVDRIDLQALGGGRALLVSNETAYPGWIALVGDQWRSMEMVNDGFRGITLQEGEERASAIYAPGSFRLGLFLSLLSIGIGFGLLIKHLLPKRFPIAGP